MAMMQRQPWKARHMVLSILSITWVISFVDRSVMSVAMPYITADFKLTPWESGLVMSAFFGGYAISQIPGGILADRFGVRRVAVIAMLWWSIFTAVTGAAAGFVQMLVVRFIFGLGEGLYPACVFKTIAVWFPKRERATANALKFAAGSLGATLSPLVVVWIMSYWGWRDVFYFMLLPGALATFLFWRGVADRPADDPRVSADELAEIAEDGEVSGDGPERKLSLRGVLLEPNILRYALVIFSFDIAYWGITTWLPTYLVAARGFSMMQMGVAATLPAFAGAIGCVLGGWVSDRWFSRNRRALIVLTQLASALLFYLSYVTPSVIALIAYQTLAGLTLNMFFTAFWALPMITIPRAIMGSASGVINMAGQIAAFVSPVLIGLLVSLSGGGYGLTFALLILALLLSCALMYTIPRNVAADD